jgi:hypothetical protein
MISVTFPLGTGLFYSLNNSAYSPGIAFSGLSTGSYAVSVKDSAGCVSPSITVVIQAQPPTPAAPTLSVTQPDCTVPTGTITITSPIDTGLVFAANGTTYGSGPTFGDLVPGNYSIVAENKAGCSSPSSSTSVNAIPPICNTCGGVSQNSFADFIASPHTGTATTLWFNLHTALSDSALTKNGDYLLFSGGILSLNGINESFDSSVNLPNGELIADNKIGAPATSYNASTNTWITRVPLAYSSADIFISGAAITSSTGYALSGGNRNIGLIGNFTSNKSLSSRWFYGLAYYQPTFTNSTAGTINVVNGIPMAGHPAGAPVEQATGWVQGGSGGLAYTGSYSMTDNFTACIKPQIQSVTSTIISVYPNPYAAEVNFDILPSESGKGSLVLYDILGQRLTTVFDGDFVAGVIKTITFQMSVTHRQTAIYLFRIGNHTTAGKLISQF